MSPSSGQFDSESVKHLELIQAVIARLANEAALIRGWALTVSVAFYGFAAQTDTWLLNAIGLLPAIAFWGLNAYYLRAEQQYRSLYDRVRHHDPDVEAFSMHARDENVGSIMDVALSGTLRTFYGLIVVVGVVLLAVDLPCL